LEEKLRLESRNKIKFSKNLIDLRFKEDMLVKIKNYQDAENLKNKADSL
jgi:hypothetical protein